MRVECSCVAHQVRGELRVARRERGGGRLVGLRGGGGRQRARAVRRHLLVVCKSTCAHHRASLNEHTCTSTCALVNHLPHRCTGQERTGEEVVDGRSEQRGHVHRAVHVAEQHRRGDAVRGVRDAQHRRHRFVEVAPLERAPTPHCDLQYNKYDYSTLQYDTQHPLYNLQVYTCRCTLHYSIP